MVRLILASNSPRRQDLLLEAGLDFEVRVVSIEETYPNHLPPEAVAPFLSEKKAMAFPLPEPGTVVLTADTVVIAENRVLGKPKNQDDAALMLKTLSDRWHVVITGVSLRTTDGIKTFSETTKVHFMALEPEMINHYVNKYQPMDKAGAYGIQEWIGMIGIDKIEGSYHNVVGLPMHRVYAELKKILG